MLYKKLADLMRIIQEVTELAGEGIHKQFFHSNSKKETYFNLKRYLDYNKLSKYYFENYSLFKESKKLNVWHDDVVNFLYKEFILIPSTQDGSIYNRELGKLKKKDFQYNFKTEPEIITNKYITPLISLFDDFEKHHQVNGLNNAKDCLIITALPLEFRSIIRRFAIITDVNYCDYKSKMNRYSKHKTKQETSDPFLWVMNSTLDEIVDVRIDGINRKGYRPFFLMVTGDFYNGSKVARLNVLLLPGCGPFLTREGLRKNKHIFKEPYKEIIISGIAASIDKEKDKGKKVKLGDLIISENIYGDFLQFKCVIKDKKLQINNTIPFKFEKISFPYKEWKPNYLTENIPLKFKCQITSDVHSCNIASVPMVVKATWFKNSLHKNFKKGNCKAVEMESIGSCFFSDENNDQKVRVIKGICDLGDHNKKDDLQPYCADLAAEFTFDYILHKYGKNLEDLKLK